MNIPSVNTKVEFIRYEYPLYMTAPQSSDKTSTRFPPTSPVPMPLDASGLCRIKNIKDNVYVGRSLVEDDSLLPKSLVPLTPEELGRNAVFEYNLGFNHTLWEFHSLGSGVAKAEVLPNGKPALRPAAILEKYIVRFNWEIQENSDRTLYAERHFCITEGL